MVLSQRTAQAHPYLCLPTTRTLNLKDSRPRQRPQGYHREWRWTCNVHRTERRNCVLVAARLQHHSPATRHFTL